MKMTTTIRCCLNRVCLFKRENLTGLQSILQNQIAKFGQHFFKEGSKVIPGNTTYIDNYKCVVINKEYLGITVESYIDQLLDQKIIGATSGVSATIVKIVKSARFYRR